jgi:predicted  nucleic acid-binding Zn-ribbon protein
LITANDDLLEENSRLHEENKQQLALINKLEKKVDVGSDEFDAKVKELEFVKMDHKLFKKEFADLEEKLSCCVEKLGNKEFHALCKDLNRTVQAINKYGKHPECAISEASSTQIFPGITHAQIFP